MGKVRWDPHDFFVYIPVVCLGSWDRQVKRNNRTLNSRKSAPCKTEKTGFYEFCLQELKFQCSLAQLANWVPQIQLPSKQSGKKKKKVWYLRGVTYLPISLTSWEAFLIENWIESSSLTIRFICSVWKYDWSARNNPKPRTESHSYRISSTSQDQSLYVPRPMQGIYLKK